MLKHTTLWGIAAGLGLAAAGNAALTVTGLGTASPFGNPATAGMTPAIDDTSKIFADVISAPLAPGKSVLFSSPLSHRAIGSGWATWSHGYTGDVYYTNGAASVTLSFDQADMEKFYFYVEPGLFGLHPFSVTANGGGTTQTVTTMVEGASGAQGFVVVADEIDNIVISIDDGGDFAVGEFGWAKSPQESVVAFGLSHTPLGQAELEDEPDGDLMVSNIGSSGEDGVGIALGEAEGWQTSLTNLEWSDKGSFLEVPLTGTIDGLPNQTIGVTRLVSDGSNLLLSGDFTSIGSSSNTVEVWNSGQLVARQTGVVGTAATILPAKGPGQSLIFLLGLTIFLLVGVIVILTETLCPCYSIVLPDPTPIIIGAGLWMGAGDEIRIIPENPTGVVSAASGVECLAAEMASFTIEDEAPWAFGAPHHALGDAVFSGISPDALTIANLGSSGEDGVTTTFAPAASLNWALQPATESAALGATFVVEARGTVDGQPDQTVFTLSHLGTEEGFILSPDFTGIGAPTFSMTLYQGDTVIYQQSGMTGAAGTQMVGFPYPGGGCLLCPLEGPYCKYDWVSPLLFQVAGGPTIEATRADFFPEVATRDFAWYTRLTALASAMPSISILDFEMHSAACPADLDGNGIVNGFDLGFMLGDWTAGATYTPCPPLGPADLNGDCKVNGFDLGLMLGAWGNCP